MRRGQGVSETRLRVWQGRQQIDVDVHVKRHTLSVMTQIAPSDVELSIRDIAEKFDVTPRTLRFYEQKGLLNPKRRGGSR